MVETDTGHLGEKSSCVEDLLKAELDSIREDLFRAQHNIDFKRQLIVTLQSRCSVLEQAIPAIERRLENVRQECHEKEKTITTLKQHVLDLRQRNEKLELNLMNAYGRLDAEVEKFRYCGHGCDKCDQERLDDLKKLFPM